MIRVILFDVDGLVIQGRKFYFSQRLSKEHNIPLSSIEEFFLSDFKQCVLGTADLKDVIVPYLERWNWQGSVDELLKYWFESESAVDEKVFDVVKNLRAKGIKCYLATQQEKYRLQYLLEDVGLNAHFDGAFCTCTMGCAKSDPQFFQSVLSQLELPPSGVLLFDDSQKNIDAALTVGIKAHFYEGIHTLHEHLGGLLG